MPRHGNSPTSITTDEEKSSAMCDNKSKVLNFTYDDDFRLFDLNKLDEKN